MVDPLAPLPPGAHARCGTARMRFVGHLRHASIDNKGRIRSLEGEADLVLRDVVNNKTLGRLPKKSRIDRILTPRMTLLSPDGTRVVRFKRTQDKGHVVVSVWDVEGRKLGSLEVTTPDDAALGRQHIGAHGKLAWFVANHTVIGFSLQGPRLLYKGKLPRGERISSFSSDGSRVAAYDVSYRGDDHALDVIDVKSGRRLVRVITHAAFISADGKQLFLSRGNDLDVVDVATGKTRPFVHIGVPPDYRLQAFLVGPDNRRLALSYGADTFLVDLASRKAEKLALPPGSAFVAFSPDGRLLLAKWHSTAVVVGKAYPTPKGHRSPVAGLAFLDGGRVLASTGDSLRLWDPRTGAPLGSTSASKARSHAELAVSPDGRRLAIGARDLEIVGTARKTIKRFYSESPITGLSFAPGGSLLVSEYDFGTRYLSESERPRLRCNGGLCRVNPDGKVVASTQADHLTAFAASPDGKHVAIHSHFHYSRGQARLVDLATLGHSEVLPGLDDYGAALAFAGPDTLIAASPSKGAVAWNVKQRRITRRFALGNCCSEVATSPDGKLLAAAAGTDVQLWEVATRRLRGVFRGHSGDVTKLAFSPDGRWLASASEDTSVMVWDTHAAPKLTLPKPAIENVPVATLAALAEGRNSKQLSYLDQGVLKAPGETLPPLPAGLVAIARSHGSSCAITAAHKVVCWGPGTKRLLRAPGQAPAKPQTVPGVSDAQHLVLGPTYACAIDSHGAATCWGSLVKNLPPDLAARLPLTGNIREVGIQLHHACALATAGYVACWDYLTSPKVVPGIRDAVAIAVGDKHSCALRRTGAVLCWGDNHFDQLGTGTGLQSSGPAAVRGLTNVKSLSASGDATCAVKRSGQVLCWGRLAGHGRSEVHLLQPTAIDGLGKAQQVRLIDNQVCVEQGGSVRCARFEAR